MFAALSFFLWGLSAAVQAKDFVDYFPSRMHRDKTASPITLKEENALAAQTLPSGPVAICEA